MVKRTLLFTCLIALALCIVPSFNGQTLAAGKKLTIAGASDLSFAFKEITAQFQKETGYEVVLSLGSTGMLARQIEQGAPFDAFFSANTKYVEDLEKGGHILPGTVRLYAQGRIVIATRAASSLKIAKLEDLRNSRITRIAIANPEHAPYGIAAMEALKSKGLWDDVKQKLVYGENIRQTLQFIESGNAEAGIVALSIANVPGIEHSDIPSNLHKPINQAAGVVSTTKDRDGASSFIRFVNGPKGGEIMKKYGFLPPKVK